MTAMMACGMAVQAQSALTKQQAERMEKAMRQNITAQREFKLKVNKLRKAAE